MSSQIVWVAKGGTELLEELEELELDTELELELRLEDTLELELKLDTEEELDSELEIELETELEATLELTLDTELALELDDDPGPIITELELELDSELETDESELDVALELESEMDESELDAMLVLESDELDIELDTELSDPPDPMPGYPTTGCLPVQPTSSKVPHSANSARRDRNGCRKIIFLKENTLFVEGNKVEVAGLVSIIFSAFKRCNGPGKHSQPLKRRCSHSPRREFQNSDDPVGEQPYCRQLSLTVGIVDQWRQ